jgi:dipeptidyl aminopeptidase/acylaminoacyl peptidase
MAPGKDTPKVIVMNDNLPGSGPYPAAYFSDNTLPNHTIYAPKSPPKDIKLPVVIWGNGGCGSSGVSFQNFLREVASHGFVTIANGAATGGTFVTQTKMNLMTESLDWVMKDTAVKKYGNIDSSKIAAAGQSCGGLEAYSATYHDDRVKTAMIMNSGVIDEEKVYLLGELKVPIAYFIGGPKDIAYNMVRNISYYARFSSSVLIVPLG